MSSCLICTEIVRPRQLRIKCISCNGLCHRTCSTSQRSSSKRACAEINCETVETTEVETFKQDVEWIKNLTCHASKSGIGLAATMSRLDNDHTCKVHTDIIVLHSAFRAALKKQLTVLHDESNLAAVLYHGAPGVGKSSLALATAYYLALAHGSSCIVKFQHRSVARSDVYEGILKQYMFKKCVIFDQINTNTLHPSCLTVKKQRKENVFCCLPFTFFTAGHYPPPKCWTKLSDFKHIRYRVIDMAMQEEDVRELFQDCEATETLCSHINSIFNISASYGILKKSVFELEAAVRYHDVEPYNFVQVLYGMTEMENSQLELSKEFWVLWPSFFRMSKKDQRHRLNDCVLKAGNFLISQEQMQYLSLKLSQVKLCKTDPLLKVLSWVVLVPNNNDRSCTGSTMSEYKHGYVEFEDDQYSYTFADVKLLRHLLEVGCCYYRPDIALLVFCEAYKLVREKANTTLNYVAGSLFEECIRNFTTCHQVEGKLCGLWFNMPDVSATQVDIQGEASNVQELLDFIPCQKVGKCEMDHISRIWLYLNRTGKMPFPGFDFAFLDVRHDVDGHIGYIVNVLQLFHATVSPASKTGQKAENMGNILINISEELIRRGYMTKESSRNIVKPFLLVPSDVVKTSYIKIQSEDKSSSWHVPIVCIENPNFML